MSAAVVSPSATSTLPRWLPAIVWAITCTFQFLYTPNTDSTWLLTVAARVMAGADLYSADIVELNTPLTIQIMMPVVWVAQQINAPAYTVWFVFVALLVAGMSWFVDRILRRTLGGGAADLRLPIMSLVVMLLVSLPGVEFGQREHLVLVGLLPYVIVSAQRALGEPGKRSDRVIAGVLMGLALWVKPHYAMAVVVVELGIAVMRRSARVWWCEEILAGAAVILLYGAYVVVAVPGFFTQAIPLGLQFYGDYGSFRPRFIHFSYLLTAAAMVMSVKTPRAAVSLSRLLLLAAAGAWLAFLVQNKGYPYHMLPTKTFSLAVVGVAAASLLRLRVSQLSPRPDPRTRRRLVVVACLALLTVASGIVARSVYNALTDRTELWLQILEEGVERVAPDPDNVRFMSLSVDSYPAFPLVAVAGWTWSSRFMCLWMLPGIINGEGRSTPPTSHGGRRLLMDAVVSDFERWRPNVVLVPRITRWESVGTVVVLDELLRDSRFRTLWDSFERRTTIEGWDIFVKVP